MPPPPPAGSVQGTDGPDTLTATTHPAVMIGGKGDDIYMVTDPADVVIEQSDGGVDEVRTDVGYTLPENVENMSVFYSNLVGGGNALVGNSLGNRITGAALEKTEIYGLAGDDILDAGGRYGAYLDGGLGNDTLINNIGESRGGPGADIFVVRPRGAMTAPDVPLTVLDFTPAEGDRIDGSFLGGADPAALFASGNLQFDAANHRLIYTRDPAAFATRPTAVEQIILLPGVTSFDPAWIIRR
jgi:Ca2+-binding RTX toxin-like protein